jgi:hypothetical protein
MPSGRFFMPALSEPSHLQRRHNCRQSQTPRISPRIYAKSRLARRWQLEKSRLRHGPESAGPAALSPSSEARP